MNQRKKNNGAALHPLEPLSRKDYLTAILLSTLTLGAYAFTAAPGVTLEDSGDFINGVLTLGVVHPPGYPLYTVLGHLFAYLPLGDPSFRVNLFSALWGALCLGVMFLVLRTLRITSLYAFFASLLLGFTGVFWSKTAVAEVYTFNVFLLALIVFWILSYNRDKKPWQLYLTGLTTGLALANHYPLAILSGLGLLFLLDRKDLRLIEIFKASLFLALGLTPYLYLFIQAYNPDILYNFGKSSNFSQVLDHIFKKYYGTQWGATSWDKVFLVLWFLKAVALNFLFASVFLLSGLTVTPLSKGQYRYPFLLSALATSLGLILILQVPSNELYRAYLLDFTVPAFLFLSIFLAVGVQHVMTRYVKNSSIQITVLLALLLSQVAFHFPRSSHHNDRLAEIWSQELLNSLKPNAILILCDASPFQVYSHQLIRGVRPDVTIYDRFSWWTQENLYKPKLLFRMRHDPPGYRRRRERELIETSQRPVYYSCKDILTVEKIPFSSTPFVYRVDQKRSEASDPPAFKVSDRLLDSLVHGYPRSEYWIDRTRAVIFNRFISYFGGHNRPEVNRIIERLKETELYSQPSFLLSLANNLYYFKNYVLAQRFYARAEDLSLESFSSIDLAVYCNLLANARNYDEALGICMQQERSSPPCADNTVSTQQTIAAIYKEKEVWSKVAQYSRKIIECQPEHTTAQNYLKEASQRTRRQIESLPISSDE